MRKKRIKKNNFFKHFLVLILCLSIIIIISFPLSRKLTKQYKINDEIKKLEQEIANEESRHYELKKMLNFLNSEEYIEQQARLNLNYKEEGETVLVVREKDIKQKNNLNKNLNSKDDVLEENNFIKWKKYFFN